MLGDKHLVHFIVTAALAAGLAVDAPASAQVAERVLIDSALEIDRTEVTIEEFRSFAEAEGFRTRAERQAVGVEYRAGPSWNVYRPFGRHASSPREPAVHVTWEEARAFCSWRGGRLPTAREWKRAAYRQSRAAPETGLEPERKYRYPSGDRPLGMNTGADDEWPLHAPARETRPGINGLYDMGGNVWEWLADRNGEAALTAGGSWWYGPEQTTADAMQWKPANIFAVNVGFRCAYSPS
jgi:formylglycine-generating enzyme required for sulfatase activity